MLCRKYVRTCVLAWDLMEIDLSLTNLPGYNKRPCGLLLGISVPLVSFRSPHRKGDMTRSQPKLFHSLASPPGVGWEDRRCPAFAGEKLLVEYLPLWLAFAWSFQDFLRHPETSKLRPMAMSFHIVDKSYMWFPVLIRRDAIFKTRYILNGGNINNESTGFSGKFHNPSRKCLWPRSWLQLYFSWEKIFPKKQHRCSYSVI